MEIFVAFIIIIILFFFLMLGALIYFIAKMFQKRGEQTPDKLKEFSMKKINELEHKLTPFSGVDNMTFDRAKHFTMNGFSKERHHSIYLDAYRENNMIISWADSGGIYTNGQVLAKTSEHLFHFDYDKTGAKIFLDDVYLFKLNYHSHKILDKNNEVIASYYRRDGVQDSFSFELLFWEVELYNKNTNQHHKVIFKNGNYAEITNIAADNSRTNAIKKIKGDFSKEEDELLQAIVIHEAARVAH